MKNFSEFKARIENDAAFKAKFANLKTEDEIFSLAKAEGYNLEMLSDKDLDEVAGGGKDLDIIKRQAIEGHMNLRKVLSF